MKNVFKSPKIYIISGVVIAVIAGSAWQLQSKAQSHDTTKARQHQDADTTKPRQHAYRKNDDGLDNLSESLDQLGRDLNELNVNIDLSGLDTTINDAVREALDNVNVTQIVNDALQSVKDINWDQINNEIRQSIRQAEREIKSVDANQIKLDIKNALDEINTDEIRQELDSTHLQEIIHDALKNVKVNVHVNRRVI
jgi:hypothetical protein